MGEKAGVGSGALGPDTTGAATQDCAAAMRARAKRSSSTTWTGGAGPKPARRRTAAIGMFGWSGERELRRCGSTVRECVSRKRQASGRASRPASSQGRSWPGTAADPAWAEQSACRLGQSNMNGPDKFRRTANKAVVMFHVASGGEPASACEAGAHLSHKEATRNLSAKHKTPTTRRLTDQSQRVVGVNRHARSRRRRMVLCVNKDAWPRETLRVSAQDSLMLVCLTSDMGRTSLLMLVFNCAKQSSESNSALDLSLALGMRTSSTNRLFPLENITWNVRFFLRHC